MKNLFAILVLPVVAFAAGELREIITQIDPNRIIFGAEFGTDISTQ